MDGQLRKVHLELAPAGLSNKPRLSLYDTSEAWNSLRDMLSADYINPLTEFAEDSLMLQKQFADESVPQENQEDDINEEEEAAMLQARSHNSRRRGSRRGSELLDILDMDNLDHLQYEFTFEENSDQNCGFCGDKGGRFHRCRVCDKVFHETCLDKKGFLKDAHSRAAVLESNSSVGWSCPNCENLFLLLTEEERQHIMDVFDEHQGKIDEKAFINMARVDYEETIGTEFPPIREQLERDMFRKLVKNETGAGYLGWYEFIPHRAIRCMFKTPQRQLFRQLTPREVNAFRKHFRNQDPRETGEVQVPQAQKAFIDWYKSRVKPSDTFVDSSWYGGNLRSQSYSVGGLVKEPTHQPKVTWDEFISYCLLHVLSARPNTLCNRPLIPLMPNFRRGIAGDKLWCQGADGQKMKSKLAPVPEEKHRRISAFLNEHRAKQQVKAEVHQEENT